MARDVESIALEILLSGLPAAEAEYLKVVAEVLCDRKLTVDERDQVLATGKSLGLSRLDRQRLHGAYLKQIALAMLGQGVAADIAAPELVRLSRLLGLSEEESGAAWESAGTAADELAALLLAAPIDPPPRTSIIKGMMSTASLTTAKVIAAAASLGGREMHCETCGKPTRHRLSSRDVFPISGWLKVAWAAKTFSPADFALNVGKLAIQDRKLLEQTGRGLLPVYRCRECGTIPDRWVVAKLLVGRLTSPEKPSDPEA